MPWVWMKSQPDLYLFAQPHGADFKGIAEGIFRGADEEIRLAFYFISAEEFAFIAQRLDRVDQLNGIDVVYVLCFRIIAKALMVAGQAEDVVDPQCRRAQDVALNGDPVAVAAYHLPDGIKSHFLENQAGGEGAHPHDGGLIVGDVYGIHHAFEQLPFFRMTSGSDPLGGPHSDVTTKFPCFQETLNVRFRLHRLKSSI